MTQRVMNGFEDLTGKTVGYLKIIGLTERYPAPIWQVRCTACGSQWKESHATLRTSGGICRNDSCRKSTEYEQRRAVIGREAEPTRDRYAFDPGDLKVPGRVPW